VISSSRLFEAIVKRHHFFILIFLYSGVSWARFFQLLFFLVSGFHGCFGFLFCAFISFLLEGVGDAVGIRGGFFLLVNTVGE